MAHTDEAAGAAGPVARNRRSLLSGLLQNLLVLLITFVLIAVFLEIGLRLFAPQVQESLSGLFTPDTAAGYRLRSDVSVHYRSPEADVTFNTEGTAGLRRVPGPPVPAGAKTLLALGDSFTFGMNVADGEAFPARLAAALNGDAAPRWNVLNAGVFGYGTDNEAAWLDEHGWAYKPNVVLVGFFVGNDVKDVMLGITKTVATADGRLVAAEASKQAMDRGEDDNNAQPSGGGVKGWLEKNSHAYLFLRSVWYNTFGKASSSKPTKLTAFDAASFYLKDVPPEIAAGWDKTFGALRAMKEDCDRHGATLLLVAIPTREQVYPRSWEDVKKQFALDESQVDLALPQQKLGAFAKEAGIAYVDLLPDFKAQEDTLPLYLSLDRHWTAAGHTLAAEVIAREMAKMGLTK
jgi:lysophospholipase L1-like esterase